MFQLCEQILLIFRPKENFFCPSLGDLTQWPSDMREIQHEPVVKIGKNSKAVELRQSGQGWPIPNDLDLGRLHMHDTLICDVPQVLDLDYAKGEFLQFGTQFVLSKGLKDLPNVLHVFFPNIS